MITYQYSAAQPESQVTYGPSFYPSPASSLAVSVQPGQEWISVVSQVTGKYPNITAKYIPTPCQHCSNAPCQAAAKNKAVYTRPDGIVLIDPELSSGQTQIAPACPYGKIFFNTNSQITAKVHVLCPPVGFGTDSTEVCLVLPGIGTSIRRPERPQ